MRTILQSIHFICMNNDCVSHEKALPTDPNCLPLIRKGLIRHVMQAWAIGHEEKDICRLKRCLRDFKTKDHQCLYPKCFCSYISGPWNLICKMVHGAPQCWAWALSLCFCFLHLILSIIALAFFFILFFCSEFCILWIFYAPQLCMGTFD